MKNALLALALLAMVPGCCMSRDGKCPSKKVKKGKMQPMQKGMQPQRGMQPQQQMPAKY